MSMPTDREPLADDVFSRLREIGTPTLTSQLYKLGFKNTFLHGVRPLNAGLRMAGEAVTLRFVPAREDLVAGDITAEPSYPQRRLIEQVQPGEVLVADCRGVTQAAAAGEILMERLRARGAAGFVTDGGLRDFPSISQMDFPTYAAAPSAPFHWVRHWAVDINVPIGCAEVLVIPGDVVVGDGEGVVVLPRHVAMKVAEAGLEQERLERFILGKVRAGAALPGVYPPNEQTLVEYRASLTS
jgi:regulator of RNase E activity RraA